MNKILHLCCYKLKKEKNSNDITTKLFIFDTTVYIKSEILETFCEILETFEMLLLLLKNYCP
jgi:hypothetical protein